MRSIRLTFILTGSLICFSLLIVQFQSCKHDPIGIESLDTVCFESQILPLFSSHCGMTGCHEAGSRKGSFQATSYANIVKLVTPGNPWTSKLYTVISDPNNFNFMPPTGHTPIDQSGRTLVEVWIEQGAKDTKCTSGNTGVPNQSDSICFNQTILPIVLSNCSTTGCHDASNQEIQQFSDYNSVISYVKPNNPNNSRLYTVLSASGENHMPPSPKPSLTAQQIGYFQKWISQGALDSNCPSQNCDTTGTISFANQVWPIIQNNCLGCHTTATTANYNIDLSSYSQINSTAVQSKRNNISLLVGTINQYNGFKSMPLSSTLSMCNVRKITLWVQQGAINN